MLQKIKRNITKILTLVTDFRHLQLSYSQGGEDIFLGNIFKKPTGFYIDVGAHHPKRMSNTYLFYKRGWSGINIDAMPGSMAAFKACRPRDVNLECGVGDKAGEMTFYVYQEPALNTFDAATVAERAASPSFQNDPNYRIQNKVPVQVKTLKTILTEHLPTQTKIDFLSIDAEGFDFAVIQSNDWDAFRPQYVVIETFVEKTSDVASSEIARYMEQQDYIFTNKLAHAAIFKCNRGA